MVVFPSASGGSNDPSVVDPFAPQLAPLVAAASNVEAGGGNPPYTSTDFLAIYPQFQGNIPNPILDMYINLANATVLETRWHDAWQLGMAAFVAHFATLYMQTLTPAKNPTASQVVGAAQAKGIQASKSVGSISVSYDTSAVMDDLKGWAEFKLTQYGILFASMAKRLSKAPMFVR